MTKSYRILLLGLLLLFQQCQVFSQSGKPKTTTDNRKAYEMYVKSNEYMMAKRYNEAIKLIEQALQHDPSYVDAYLRLSTIYFRTGEIEKEKEQYLKVIELVPELASVYFNYGTLLMRELIYDEAEQQFLKFLGFDVSDQKFIERAKHNIELCKFRHHAMKNPVPFDPVNLGPGPNTELDEYWPVTTADEHTLFFTRRLDQNPDAKFQHLRYNEDIFFSIFENEQWSEARPVPGNINNPNTNEGAITISPDGKFLLFTICSEVAGFGYGGCDIYFSELKDGKWFPPKNIGYPINSRHKETQPSISFDGKTLYFSSNRPGGFGKLDIWKSHRNKDGSWGEPINLGPEVNGPGNEQSPFIHPDDKTLFFSSEEKIGMGGADLFMAKRKADGTFGNVKNLGFPINTHQDEISLFVSSMGEKAYFASRKEGGSGGLDLYSFILPKAFRPDPVCYLKGIVFDKDTRFRLEADFELIDLQSGKTILESKSEARTGKFLVAIPADRNYALNVSKDGYLFYSAHLPIKGITSSAYEKDVFLTPIKVGEKLVLNNIFFEFDKSDLKDESKIELQKVIDLMQKNEGMKVEIGGHTDNHGTAAYNLKLSADRAQSVYNYLKDVGGIAPARMTYKGYGLTMPVDSNETEEGRANNRRTEFKIIEL